MSRAFFTAVGGLFVFVAFQPACGQARWGGAVNIRELALVDISAPLRRIGRRPEKLQIFLCYSPIAFCPVRELNPLAIVAISKGREFILADFKDVGVLLLPLGEGWDGASMLGCGLQLDGAHPWQLCRSCDFIAQG